MGKLAASVGLSIVLGTAIAGPQVADPNRTIDTVEVTAQREKLRQAIVTFVSNITRWDGQNVARWRKPVCPSVAGAAPEQGEFIRSRVLEVAASVGAPFSSDKKCDANLLVILTDQPEQMWAQWRARHPKMFSSESPENIKRIVETKRPVVTWQNATVNNSDGTPPDTNRMLGRSRPQYRLIDSHIRGSVSEDVFSAIVVVDTSATGRATFGQLADYVAMVSLARIDPRLDPDTDLAGTTSILRLFGQSSEGVPPRLTNWDQAFLKGLYRSRDAVLLRQRNDIALSMRDELAP
jgi:hypothetical protein